MKFTLVIAALFATSAIAAPCGKGHNHNDDVTTIPDQSKVPAGENKQIQNGEINTGNGPKTVTTGGGELVNVPVNAPIDVSDNQILNGVLNNILGSGDVTTKSSKENSIEQAQKNHN